MSTTLSPTTQASPRRTWFVIAIVLLLALFLEAAFAGAMLSGMGWARKAHAATALLLVLSTAAAGVAALVTLRRIANGTRFGLTLLALALVVVLQMALGRFIAHGANLLWLHVPLGVALVGLAGQAVAGARKLGEA